MKCNMCNILLLGWRNSVWQHSLSGYSAGLYTYGVTSHCIQLHMQCKSYRIWCRKIRSQKNNKCPKGNESSSHVQFHFNRQTHAVYSEREQSQRTLLYKLPQSSYICAACSVRRFVKTWKLLFFHTCSFLGFKGILFTFWHCCGFGRLPFMMLLNAYFFNVSSGHLGINLHGYRSSCLVRLTEGLPQEEEYAAK